MSPLKEGITMIILGIIVAGILGYLFYALVNPDKL
ncbi:K(+)-transporting ATPase subunit F [Erysipelothrix inopinata]|nr:K(+)-transporting ATPase subunit F [Erysipelothrix inopinata]